MDNEWKNSLRERFSDYSAPEPEGLWEGIEQGLAEKKRRKMLPVWLVTGLAAAAAVALVVFLRPDKTVETPVDTVERYVQDLTPETSDASTNSASEEAVPAAVPVVDATGSKPASFAVVSRRTLLAEAEPVDDYDMFLEELLGDLTEEDHILRCLSGHKPRTVEIPELVVDETSRTLAYDEAKIIEALQGRLSDPIPPSRFSVGAYQFGGQGSSEQSQGFGLGKPVRVTRGFIEDLAGHDLFALFDPDVLGPHKIAMAHGAEDAVIDPAMAARFAEKFHITETVFPGEGHSLSDHPETPDRVVDLAIRLYQEEFPVK